MRGQPLTLYEREKLEFHLRGNWGLREIGRMLHRDHSVLSRELQRNTCRDGKYRAKQAHEQTQKRLQRRRHGKLDANEQLRTFVVNRLKEEQRSPEQIAGELKKRPKPKMEGMCISHETIYQFIYEGEGRFLRLYQHLRRGRKKRQRRFARKMRRKQPISFITPIVYRPKEINERRVFGHFESDTTICENKGEALSVQYERSTQFVHLKRVCDKGAHATEGRLRDFIERYPKGFVKSITFDRGGEGAHHWKLRMDYQIDTYHCDPYSSWQKGGVENMNGLIRQYIPRGTNLSTITDHELYVIQEKLNNRPRKKLGYQTPNELVRAILESGVVH